MESPVISNLPISGTLRALRKLRILGRYSEVPFPEEVNMEMMNELVYVVDDEGKVGKADELSASIVHQLNQPLTAMLANAQAAKRWLAAEPPNRMEAIASIDRIARGARAADEMMKRIRALFKQKPLD
jgi:signal transduction histidine kinase